MLPVVTAHDGLAGGDEVWSTWTGDPLVIVGLVLFVVVYGLGSAPPVIDRPSPRWSAGRGGKQATVTAGTLAVVGTMSVWHAPALYDAALRSVPVHALEHATILGASALFWWSVVRAARRWQTLTSVAALGDQQVAGAIMWVPTAAVYLAAMASVLHRALGSDRRGHAPGAPRSRPRLDTPA